MVSRLGPTRRAALRRCIGCRPSLPPSKRQRVRRREGPQRRPADALHARWLTAAAALAPGPCAGCASMGDSGVEARHRAKVYCLNEDGQWDDRGTGHAAVQYMPVSSPADRPSLLPQPFCAIAGPAPETAARSVPAFAPGHGLGASACSLSSRRHRGACQAEEAAFIVVLSEEDGASHLLQARVLMEDIYQRQQGGRPLPQHLSTSLPSPPRHPAAPLALLG